MSGPSGEGMPWPGPVPHTTVQHILTPLFFMITTPAHRIKHQNAITRTHAPLHSAGIKLFIGPSLEPGETTKFFPNGQFQLVTYT